MNANCPTCSGPLRAGEFGSVCLRCLARVSLPGSWAGADSPGGTLRELVPGERIGDYELLAAVGRGGMGIVYRARQTRIDRIVAVKTVHADWTFDPTMSRRFRSEAEALARLHHPHIVEVHEWLEFEGRPFLVMEFVSGTTLERRLADGPPPQDAVAGLLRKLAQAMQYAHERGIVHRDLKPSNILVDEVGEPRISDFGLAKAIEASLGLTLTHQLLGSPHYMAPEQISDRFGPVGPACDIYALGAILYRMLTGRPPFFGNRVEETLLQVTHQAVPPVRRFEPAVHSDLETICLKCLEKEPARRYASAQQLADELGRFLARKPIVARPLGPMARLRRWMRREPALAALAAVSVTGLVAFTLSLVWAEFRVQERERVVRRNAYVADMRLAHQAFLSNHRGRTVELLDRYATTARGESDLRGWEWWYLRHAVRGDEILTLGRHEATIEALACSPDGRRVASASSDGDLRLWDALMWTLVGRASRAHSNSPTCLAFSPDSRTLASADAEGHIMLWDGEKLSPLGQQQIPRIADLPGSNRINAMEYTEAGRELSVVTRRRILRFPDPSRSEFTHLFEPIIVSWLYATLPPNGGWAASGENDGRVWLWDLRSTITTSWQGHNGMVSCLASSPDGNAFATGSFDKTVKVWNAESHHEIACLRGHDGSVNAVAFAPDGSHLATGSRDQTIRLWDLGQSNATAVLRGHRSLVESVAYMVDGRQLVSGSKDGELKLWSTTHTVDVPSSLPFPTNTLSMWLTADGTAVVRALQPSNPMHPTRDFDLWDTARFAVRNAGPWMGHGAGLLDVAPGGTNLAAAMGSAASAIDPAPLRVVVRDANHAIVASIPCLPPIRGRFSPDGRQFALVDTRPELTVWNWQSSEEPERFPVPRSFPLDLAFSPDGRYVAVSFENGTAEILDLTVGGLIGTVRARLDAPDLAFSPDSRWLALVSYDGTVRLWSVEQRRETLVLRGSSDGLASVAFSRDGRRLATGTLEGTVKIWDLGTEQEILELHGHSDPAVFQVAFLPDDTLVSVSVDSLRRWPALHTE